MPWPVLGEVRRGSINNFGFGGANAHVIIEEFRPTEEKLSTTNGSHRGVNGVSDHGNMNEGKNGMAPQPDQLVHMVQPSFEAQLKGKTHLIMNGEMNGHGPGSEQTQVSVSRLQASCWTINTFPSTRSPASVLTKQG